ncbi:2-oxoglutarate and iron-dependent oxygenase JMJD4 isoform X1 [Polypterus senegalus]|uniref:2-oxoglutarate and iron-dependent oxygenase JMJD4 isoform X1 n=1 Tax=Polypterus senegalus TaxID=55291 RepID=UPI001964DBE3|nr:2-oxoglutarate and iron-dependent oxygenase JMJD4 isoform X1 [Polypterus senegalus]
MDKRTFFLCRNLNSLKSGESPGRLQHVDYIDEPDFSYSCFFENCLIPNQPCVFSRRFTEDWNCRKYWVTQDGKPNFPRLLQDFGNALVPVADCNIKEYNANPKQTVPLKDYLSYWEEYIQNGYSSSRGCLYLKDWHMHREFPGHTVYKIPVFFQSDWLNEYWDSIEVDDYRFVYMGPKGTWTPFHADVFHSYSWSANVCGRKRWLLFPPGQEDCLRNCHGDLVYDVTSLTLLDKMKYPKYVSNCQPIEIIQEAGEVIFVPSGWHHQVHNLEDTISINHNWVNGCNIKIMWKFLQEELLTVQNEINEWKDSMENWHEHCQVIMKSCTGIDYKEFYTFLKTISKNRIAYFNTRAEGAALSKINNMSTLQTLGPHHCLFDLQQISFLLEGLIINEDFKKQDHCSFIPLPEDLLKEIKEVLVYYDI